MNKKWWIVAGVVVLVILAVLLIFVLRPAGSTDGAKDGEQEQTQVSVTNRGSEIDPARMDRIFQKFYQGDPSHAAEGNGIGLAIVKRVTELHGGSVRAASSHGSTCFTVTLPKSPRQSAQ